MLLIGMFIVAVDYAEGKGLVAQFLKFNLSVTNALLSVLVANEDEIELKQSVKQRFYV
jgi:hypothetical protein